jgi:hypothetical protein
VESLDTILSQRGEAVPETQETNAQQSAETEQSKQSETEGQSQEGQGEGQKTVPQAALHEERAKVRRYTEEVAAIRQEIAQRDQAWEQRIAKLMEARQQAPEPPPDWYLNPDDAFQQNLHKHLQPIVQHFEQQRQADQQRWEAASRDRAAERHGQETVDAAYHWMASRNQADPMVQNLYQRIMTSHDPWGNLIKEYERETIASDPAAYEQKVREKVLAEIQQQNGNGAAQPQRVMPSNFAAARNVGNRSGPAWGGPPSINDIFNRKRQPQG